MEVATQAIYSDPHTEDQAQTGCMDRKETQPISFHMPQLWSDPTDIVSHSQLWSDPTDIVSHSQLWSDPTDIVLLHNRNLLLQ